MIHAHAALVLVDQSERRAVDEVRHVESARDSLRERRLARPQFAEEGDDGLRLERAPEPLAEGLGLIRAGCAKRKPLQAGLSHPS